MTTETTPGLLARMDLRRPARIPVAIPEDYRDLAVVNEICSAIQIAINRGDRDDRDLHEAELKKAVKRIGEDLQAKIADAPARIEASLTPYIDQLHASGRSDQDLKDDLLETIHLLVHRGKETETLTLSQLLEQLNMRDDMVRALDREGEHLDRSNRRQVKGILTLGLLTLLTSGAALSYRGSKFEAQAESSNMRGENQALKRQLDERAAEKTQEADLKVQVDRLSGEKSTLETQLKDRQGQVAQLEGRLQQSLQSIGQAQQTIAQRDEQIQILQTAAQVNSADELRARDVRQKAKNGQHVTADEIELIRRVSESQIAQWRREAEQEAQALRSDLRRRTEAGENTTNLASQVSSQIAQIEDRRNNRIVRETQERDSLIVQGQQARP